MCAGLNMLSTWATAKGMANGKLFDAFKSADKQDSLCGERFLGFFFMQKFASYCGKKSGCRHSQNFWFDPMIRNDASEWRPKLR